MADNQKKESMKDSLINAIAQGNIEKLQGLVKEKKGNLYIIRTFVDALKITSSPIADNMEIQIDETSDFGTFLLNIREDEKGEVARL